LKREKGRGRYLATPLRYCIDPRETRLHERGRGHDQRVQKFSSRLRTSALKQERTTQSCHGFEAAKGRNEKKGETSNTREEGKKGKGKTQNHTGGMDSGAALGPKKK